MSLLIQSELAYQDPPQPVSSRPTEASFHHCETHVRAVPFQTSAAAAARARNQVIKTMNKRKRTIPPTHYMYVTPPKPLISNCNATWYNNDPDHMRPLLHFHIAA